MVASLAELGIEVQNPEPERTQEIAVSAQEVQEAAKDSLDFLAALCMPNVYRYQFPPMYLAVWKWLLENTNIERIFPQLALGLPRGFVKTTLVKIYIVYCLLFTKKRFILIIAETATKAQNILSDIVDALEEPNIKKVFGDWKLGAEKDTQDLKKFGFRGRNIILAAIGVNGSLRGLNIKNERPDVMIFDDIQSREAADSQLQSEAIETWMYGTAMKAKSPFGCIYIFLANMYPTRWSILKKLKKNPNWTKFIVGGILANGESLWEELQPIAQLKREFQNDLAAGHPEIFYSEVLNDETATTNSLVDFAKLPASTFQPGDIPAGKFIIIDPSTQRENADNVAIGYVEIHDALPMLMHVVEKKMSPGECIHTALQLALEHDCRLIAIESNAYQVTLLYWFNFVCQQLGIQGIDCVEVYSGTQNKNARIVKALRSYAAGELFVHEDARALVHSQISQFNPMRKDNIDNTLDLLTYMPKVIEYYGDYLVSTNVINMQEFANSRVRSMIETSPF